MYVPGLDSASANPQIQPLVIPHSPPAPRYLNTPPAPQQATFLPPPPPFAGGKAVDDSLNLVGDAEQEQDDLRDARDELLGARFRLQASRKELGDLRHESGARDGHVFSMVRRLIVDRPNDLMHEFEAALEEASKLRDRLGLLEASYEEAEQRYNTMEWKYTRKESSFVGRLLPSDNFLAERSGNTKELAEMAELTRFAGPQQDLSEEAVLQTYPSKLRTSEDKKHGLSDVLLETQAGELLSSTSSCKRSFFPRPNPTLTGSLPSPSEEKIAAPSMTESQIGPFDIRRNNVTGGTDTQLAWAMKSIRIDQWLRDVLAMSPLQQAQLKAMYYLDFLTDNQPTERYWDSNAVSMSVFHTGDSTVSSNGCDSLKVTSDNAYLDEHAARVPDYDSSIQIGPNVKDPGNAELPSGLDLTDSTGTELYQVPEFSTRQYGTHLSASTDPTHSRRTSASEESHQTGTTSENSAGREGCLRTDLQRSGERIQSTISLGTTTQEDFRSTPVQSVHGDESLLPQLRVESSQMGMETRHGQDYVSLVEEPATGNDPPGTVIVHYEAGQDLKKSDQGHELRNAPEADSSHQSPESKKCPFSPYTQLEELNTCVVLPAEPNNINPNIRFF